MYGTVHVSNNIQNSNDSIKIRLYYPVKSLQGPDWLLTDNYEEFILYYGEDKLAQFLFDRDYQLLCNRVSRLLGPANRTKYINPNYGVNGDTTQYLYVQDSQRYIQTKLIYDVPESTYTYHIKFNPDATDFNNFYMYVRKYVYDITSLISKNNNMYAVGLFGKDYITNIGDGDWNLGESTIKNTFHLSPTNVSVFMDSFKFEDSGVVTPIEYTIEDIESAMLNFFRNTCAFDVIELGDHHYVFSVNTPDLQFYCNRSDLVTVISESSDYYNRVRATELKDYRICSISSKYYSSKSDIKVTIGKGNYNMYKIQVLKTDGDTVNEEYFEVTKDNIETIDSNIITIDLIDDSKDFTGTYELIGDLAYYEDSYLLSYLKELDIEEWDLPQVDIALDLSDSTEVAAQLRKCFPQALIMTENVKSMDNLISISPRYITWYYTGEVLRSYFILLDLLPESVSLFSKLAMEPIEDDSDLDFHIDSTSYEYVLTDLAVTIRGSTYSLKSAIARSMVYRCISEIKSTTSSDIKSEIQDRIKDINKYLDVIVSCSFGSETISGRKYIANLNIGLENKIFEKYILNIEVNYSG